VSERFAAWRFDGRTAQARAVRVRVEADALVIESPEGADIQRLPMAQLRISEPFEYAPRLVYADPGETVEVPDGRGISRAIEAAGFGASRVVRLQRHWPVVSGALALLLVALACAYVYGLPAAARLVADATPRAIQERMGKEILDVLDRNFLAPSALSAREIEAIEIRFGGAALRSAPDERVRVEFRMLRSEAEGESGSDEREDSSDAEPDHMINAFSLPGGTFIVLDGLVEATDRDEVFAVLGHELGHAVHRHGLRQLFQSAGAAALAGLVWGDFSGAAASIPTTLGVLRYHREFEQESDDFAVRFLADAGLDAEPLCRFFERVLELEDASGYDDIPEFLSTHPDTWERLTRICPEESELGDGA
jgi:Zn-dependent protease with chaperone function